MAMLIIFLALSFLPLGALGELVCDNLPPRMCSFAVASSGKRCSLETGDRPGVFQCQTSEVVVSHIREHIETDDCIRDCGLDRATTGISSDLLMEPKCVDKICSKKCLNNCPNIVDLYSNLALAERMFLPGMCKKAQENKNVHRRMMSAIRSWGGWAFPVAPGPGGVSSVAPGPISSEVPANAPGPSENVHGPISSGEAAADARDPSDFAVVPISSTEAAADAPGPSENVHGPISSGGADAGAPASEAVADAPAPSAAWY